MPYITILNGPNHGRTISLTPSLTCRIGRDPSLELCVDDPKASRVHVEIECQAGKFVLRDLRSKNGTLLNGARTSGATLNEGDEIQIGETKLAFSMAESPLGRPRDRHDSILAPRVPLGVVPTSGEGQAGFETLELDAPLPILRLEGNSSSDFHDAPTAAMSRDTPATLERANRCLRGLYSVARTCAESRTTQELFSVLAARLGAALEADRVTPILLDESRRWRVVELDAPAAKEMAGAGRPKAVFSRVPVSRTIVDHALQTKRSVLTAPRSDARFERARSIGEQGISSAMCVPIVVGEKTLGLIYADRLGGQDFDREDHELLTAACLQAAPALAGLCRLEELEARKERLIADLKSEHNLLGNCSAIRKVHGFIERAAPTDSVVLVQGESGTGKELVARAIHYSSGRREGPFVVVNCAALSESLIESELFGHAKGAFTGATADRKGRFELAHEGSIFLDEIGELSAACQTKLLRVLEQKEISRVGEGRVRKINVRLVAASNRDLAAEVQAKRFREDLFYRLNVLAVELPPLREREADIRLLAEHYLNQAALRGGRPRLSFSQEAHACLERYRWPGNVRELRNLTERLAVLCPHEVIGVRDLPAEFHSVPPESSAADERNGDSDGVPAAAASGPPPGSGDVRRPLSEIEKEHILRVLAANGGNKKQSAEVLGIDRSTLYAKLRAYGIIS